MPSFDSKSLDDYVDVAQRIADFRERYPEGSLQPLDPAKPWEQAVVNGYSKDGKPFAATMIVYVAAAYRAPDDQRPGIGMAWEPFPGRTSFTLGSELQNAETSAWGRAIVAALASDSKRGVSSREEVRNRAAENGDGGYPALTKPAERGPAPAEQDHWTDKPAGQLPVEMPPEERPGTVDGRQRAAIFAEFKRLSVTETTQQRQVLGAILNRNVSSRKGLSYVEAEQVLKDLKARKTPASLGPTGSASGAPALAAPGNAPATAEPGEATVPP